MDMKRVLNLTIEVMRSDGVKWESLTENEQSRIIMKLPEIRNAMIDSMRDVLGIVGEKDSNGVCDERIVHTQNGDITITDF